MAGFFSKKQYTAMAEIELAMTLLKERCLECSIWAMFFNSSLTVSIKARFLNRILSATLIREFEIFEREGIRTVYIVNHVNGLLARSKVVAEYIDQQTVGVVCHFRCLKLDGVDMLVLVLLAPVIALHGEGQHARLFIICLFDGGGVAVGGAGQLAFIICFIRQVVARRSFLEDVFTVVSQSCQFGIIEVFQIVNEHDIAACTFSGSGIGGK